MDMMQQYCLHNFSTKTCVKYLQEIIEYASVVIIVNLNVIVLGVKPVWCKMEILGAQYLIIPDNWY